MTAIGASAPGAQAVRTRGFSLRWSLVSVGTGIALLGFALLPLLTPVFMHPALDAAGSSAWLQLPGDQVHALSDQTVHELVFGPGTFALTAPGGGPFYAADEASHMRDARALLYVFLVVAAIGAAFAVASLALARRHPAMREQTWRAIGRGGSGLAVAVVVLGVVGFVAFEPAFELFHEVFFPGGNWAFDPRTSHLVQLYPYDFWQIAAASLGAIAALLGVITWAFARSRARRAAAA